MVYKQPEAHSMKALLESIHCTPSRRSMKFVPGPESRHYLAFDATISKEDRLVLYMELFALRELLVDRTVLPSYTVATYTPESLVEIRVVTDPRHPAYGQAGLYARRSIAANTIVSPYAGFVEVFGTSCNSRTYTMGFGSISDDYALDAEFCGNYGRFANDPRGVEGLTANISAESKFNPRGESFTALVARRQIAEGEEILMAYGKAHSLSASPWMSVEGEALTRQREGGLTPLPLFDGQPGLPSVTGAGAAAAAAPWRLHEAAPACGVDGAGGRADGASAAPPSLAYDVMWECAQCGQWNASCSPAMVRVELCSFCGSPKLSGSRLVALLCSPPLTLAELEPRGEKTASVARAESALDLCMDALETAWRNRHGSLFPSTAAGTALPGATRPCDAQEGRPGEHTAVAALSTSPVSPSSSAQSSAAQSASGATRSRRDRRRSSATSPTSGSSPGAIASAPTAQAVGSHHVLYRSVHVDWPMNVPFLCWQVWDSAVPIATLEKHSRFETMAHVLLYCVNGEESDDWRADLCDAADESADSEDLTGGSATASTGRRKRRRRTRADLWARHDEDELPAILFRDLAEPSQERDESTAAPADSADAVVTGSAASSSPASLAAPPSAGADGARDTSSRTQPARWPGNTNATADGEINRVAQPSSPPAARDPNAMGADHSDAARREDEGNRRVEHSMTAAPARAAVTAAVPPLSRALALHRDVERFVLLETCPPRDRGTVAWPTFRDSALAFSPCGSPLPMDSAAAVARPLRSPVAVVRAALRRMSRRPFAGKPYRPGDVVAYVGGTIRRLDDPRCRPEHSPLAIPMVYFAPTALRRRLAAELMPTAETAAPQADARSACDRRASHDGLPADGTATDGEAPRGDSQDATATLHTAARSILQDGAADLLTRLSELCLVVTNELMFCPVLAVASAGWTAADDSAESEEGVDGDAETSPRGTAPSATGNAPAEEPEADGAANCVADALKPDSARSGSEAGDGDGTSTGPASPAVSPQPESPPSWQQLRQQWRGEAATLLRACNLALALTVDALGCPHVAAIATRHIAAFEPLLARMQ